MSAIMEIVALLGLLMVVPSGGPIGGVKRTRHDPIEPYLAWPGLDLYGAGGAALLCCAMEGAEKEVTVPQLLMAGANPKLKCDNGLTPLEAYTRQYNDTDPRGLGATLADAARQSDAVDAP